MIRNYIKAAIRNVIKHKKFSLINILGLIVGMVCSIMIMIFIQFELSFDGFHENKERIYRVALNVSWGDTRIEGTHTPAILTKTFYQSYPEVEISLRLKPFESGIEVKRDEKNFNEYRVTSSDPEFFQMFSFPLLSGNAEKVLKEPNSVVLSSSIALKYFGKTDPMGQVLTIGGIDYRVTGVMSDMPANSHFHFDIIVSLVNFDGIKSTNWLANDYRTYILLNKGVSLTKFEAKLPTLIKRYMFTKGNYDQWSSTGNFWTFYLQPLSSIHLHSDLSGEFEPNGNAAYVNMFLLVSICILLLAAANYMNLSTASSGSRAREVEVRRVVGATRFQLIFQFLSESILLSFIAMIIAVGMVHILLPFFGNMVQRPLIIPYQAVPWLIPGLLGMAITMGIISGAYPSFFLSSSRHVKQSQRNTGRISANSKLRNTLVFFQFAISILVLIGTFIVQKQLNFIMKKDLGFSKDKVIVVKTTTSMGSQSKPFKEALRKNSAILEVSGSNTLPGGFFNNSLVRPEGSDKGITMDISLCEPDFLNVLKLKMDKGRFFSHDSRSDSTAVILNQSAVNLLGWKEPIGRTITPGSDIPFHVIGVVQNYHYKSLHQAVRPAALALLNGSWNWWPEKFISLRIQGQNLPEIIKYLRSTWDKFNPGKPLEYSFLDEDYDSLYSNEQQTGILFFVFSVLTIFITSFGLYGLLSFNTHTRKKEIGIRKTLGATNWKLVHLFSIGFIKLLVIANLIAWPIAWYVMKIWLKNFAYHIDLKLSSFIFASILVFIVSFFTITFQTIKAARANPIDSLKYE